MWSSSEDSDTPPATAEPPRAGGRSPKQDASKVKGSRPTGRAPAHAGPKTQSRYCAGNSDSASDSDSSGAEGASADHESGRAPPAASSRQTCKPAVKPGAKPEAKPAAELDAKPHAKPESKLEGKTWLSSTQAAASKKLPSSGREAASGPVLKAQPGAGAKTQPTAPASKSGAQGGAVWMGAPAHHLSDLNYSMDFPTLGSDLPSKEKAPSKGKTSPRPSSEQGQWSARKAAGSGEGPGKKAFSKHSPKASDTEGGQQFSRREEKLSFNDFLPEGMQDKKQKKKKRGGQRAENYGASRESLPETFAESDRVKSGAAVNKRCAAARHEADGSESPPWKQTGGSTRKPGRSKQQGRDSSGTDDSEDDSVSLFLTSKPHYVPPLRRPDKRESAAESRTAKDRTPPASAETACALEEETIPKQALGNWPRGQRPGGNPARGPFGRREDHRYHLDRNRGAPGNEDNPRQNRRDMERNWRERGDDDDPPGHRPDWRNNRNGGDRANWRQNQNYRNVPNNQEAAGAREGDPDVRGEPHRPPPPEEAHEDGQRGVPGRPQRPNRPAGNRAPHPPQPAGLRPLEANLSFGRLRELKAKQPAEVVAALTYSKEGLSRLLKNEDKLSSNAQLLTLLLGSLAKACVCSSMPAQRGEILNLVRTSSFLRVLGTHLATSSLTGQVSDVISVIGDSADLLRTMLSLFPSCFHDVVMVHAFIDMAQKQVKLRGGGDLPEDVAHKVEQLNVVKDGAVEELHQKESRSSGAGDEDSQSPPEDFRLISVFPTMDDLNKEELPFLRKNKVVGGYRTMDHYLDVQFRLLREDFVYPLREGIAEYLKMIAAPRRGQRLRDIRVYHDVHILRAVCLPSGLGHRLTFDVSRMKRVRWEVSKRLIYGSLVCLSADDFQTLFFATVSNREPADLREGIVDVIFEHDLQEVSAIPPETTFTMAETTAFFEAYRHVLSGLQTFQEDQMPFQKYIVKCDKKVAEPRYLTETEAEVKYDLRPLADEGVSLREDKNLRDQGREVPYDFSGRSQPAGEVPVLRREDWPDPQLLHLDGSQFEALHNALTKEFSVIQGPPGTGKTYVGLKIVKALLHNRKCWDPTSESCMLIVCFTNHALDQFLEGVVSFFNGKVVRVGSRLRSEKLESYSLNNLRWSMRRQRGEGVDRDFREITRLRFQGYDAMDRLKQEIDFMGVKIESAKREILHEEVLMPYMLDRHYERLLDARYNPYEGHYGHQGRTKRRMFCIPEWLGIGAILQNRHLTAQHLRQLDQDLELGAEDEDLDIEGEVQALEEQHRLDTDDVPEASDKQKRAREKKRALAKERTSCLALDISGLDQGVDAQQPAGGEGAGGGGGGGGGGAFQIPRNQWKKIKRRLRRNVELEDRMSEMEERQVRDLWTLDLPQRWRLYRRWTHALCRALKAEMSERERLYDELARKQQETLMQEDKHILKTATVIAMTTTAAARYQSVLQEVKPKVIVVEEAAEVLEGHVITTLSGDCQHLILIGDHKQLRPNPTVYSLASKYNLELSLFERMINNGLKCTTLGWQHRMRPEIAALVRPIYPALNNHPSVEDYEAVKGVSSNLFFISHGEPEEHDEETKSHSNLYEAHYLVMLCQYLLKQGYHPSQITVLTTYSGQLFQLRRLMPKKSIFDGVRVTVVDNFQGEENDIILLSLVRSNEEGNIGFLKIENRVCVALSRAKRGLYVIGNFDLLSAESRLWRGITADLRGAGRLGGTLHLYCQNHPRDKGVAVQSPEDFNLAPEGGCMKPCTTRLDCGHVCQRMCHPYDKDHAEYKCTRHCERKMNCEFQHDCRKQCFQDCGECTVRVQRRVSRCGHLQWMACCTEETEFICQEDCQAILPCGHQCGDKCGERHRCFEKVEHTWPCGHTGTVQCADKDSTPCDQPCAQQLACGHVCAGTCCECHSGRLHKPCGQNCSRILVCGHSCRDACSNCPPCGHKCENSCVHSSCPKRCGLPCPPCKEPCVWQCPHHSCRKLCHEPCDRPRCNEPCPSLLKCDHPCIGLCGEPCPRLCRICDAEEVTTIVFGTEEDPDARFVELEDCGHVLEASGLDRWMSTTTEDHKDSVQLKACPVCKTPIRKNLRYGDIVKTQLRDIETVKARMQGDDDKRKDALVEIELMIDDENDSVYEDMKRDILGDGDSDSLGGLVAMVNQMTFLEESKKLKVLGKKKKVHSVPFSEAQQQFEKWLCARRQVFSEQESQDAQMEAARLKHWLALMVYTHLAKLRDVQLPAKLADPVNNMILRMRNGRPYSEEHRQTTSDLLKELEALVPESGLGVSDQERVMIVKAMGLTQGHWFKCPQGHIYAIGDCGGATEESRCPECKAAIGGRQHRLREDNALAPEMDNARSPAWPTAVDAGAEDLLLEDLF